MLLFRSKSKNSFAKIFRAEQKKIVPSGFSNVMFQKEMTFLFIAVFHYHYRTPHEVHMRHRNKNKIYTVRWGLSASYEVSKYEKIKSRVVKC